MNPEELFNNFFKEKGINMGILEPEPIVLPIPKNVSDVSISIQILVYIINNTLESVRLHPNDTLMPEVITSDGQTLKPEVAIEEYGEKIHATEERSRPSRFLFTRWLSNLVSRFGDSKRINFDDRSLEPRQGKKTSPTLRLLWCTQKLELQFLKEPSCLPVSFELKNCYYFKGLEVGAYQLRFVRNSSGELRESDSNRETEAIAPSLTTQLASLRLLEPVGADGSAVEVDGVRFETVVPQPTLRVPNSQLNAYTIVELGIRISNNTNTCFRFSLFGSLIPQVVGTDGQPIKADYGRHLTIRPKRSHFPLVKSGESLTFCPKVAQLFWSRGDSFVLSIPAGDGGSWGLRSLNLGTYNLNFTYKNKDASVTIPERERRKTELLEDILIGMVCTPSVTFSLI